MDRRRKSPHAQLANIWGEHFGARHVCLICVPFLQWKNKHIQRALSPLHSSLSAVCLLLFLLAPLLSFSLCLSLSHFWWQHKLHKFSFYFLFISFCCWSVQVQWTLFIAVVSIVVVLASLLLLLLRNLLVLALLIQLFLWYAVAHSTAPSASALLLRRLCVTTTCSAPLFLPTSLPLSLLLFFRFHLCNNWHVKYINTLSKN